jgi:hypothetical protein
MKRDPRSLALAVAVDLVAAVVVAVPAAASEIAGSLSSRIQTGAVIVKIAAPFFCLVDDRMSGGETGATEF